VRTALGIEVQRHDYQQTAIICNVSPEHMHAGRAFESFTPTGPFALLPHRDGRCGLVWSVATEQAQALLDLPDDAFLQQAEQRFGDDLGRWKKIGRRSSYPLKLVRARTDWQPRVVVLGNAAHAIHPIAAQGFNLGLRDVAVLAEVLADGLAAARRRDALFDPGATALLQAYSDLRREDHQETIAYTDGLARLYASPGALAAAARRAGLLAHRLVPSWRRRLAIRAMGFRGHIPRLAQGESLAEGSPVNLNGKTGEASTP
jgi:2-octaprenyl-6-methoxyphenol hydroxylase